MSFGFIDDFAQGSDVYATISVTYPSGSTCTCTNGTKTLTAEGTSGSYIFSIPKAGTWTVTATDGTKTSSKSVSITTKNQSENVALLYRFYLFKSGEGTASGYWNQPTANDGNYFNNTNSFGVSNTSTRVQFCFKPKVNLAGFNTLKVDLVCIQKQQDASYCKFGIGNEGNNNSYWDVGETVANSGNIFDTTRKTYSLDISNFQNSYYVKVGTTERISFTVYNVWLEQ